MVPALFLIAFHVAQREFEELLPVAFGVGVLLEIVFGDVVNVEGENHLTGGTLGLLVEGRQDGGENLSVALVELFFYFVEIVFFSNV